MSTDFYDHLHVGDVQKYDSESFIKNSIYFDESSSSEAFNELSTLNEYTDSLLQNPLKTFTDITRENYQLLSSVYKVDDIEIPPSDYETVSSAFVLDAIPEGKAWHDLAFNSLKVPPGYKANFGKLNIGFSSGSGRYIAGYLGNKPV